MVLAFDVIDGSDRSLKTQQRSRRGSAFRDHGLGERLGGIVGRIWICDYTGKSGGEMARWLWHWDRRNVEGRKDASGHCGSLHEAMAQFRAARDAPGDNVIGIGG